MPGGYLHREEFDIAKIITPQRPRCGHFLFGPPRMAHIKLPDSRNNG
ncbi:hypothetical protein [Haematobacter sp.]|nr:hypothetical protein [Haematobacter sp.]